MAIDGTEVRMRLLTATSLGASLALFAGAHEAAANGLVEEAGSKAAAFDEIVVTATRRATNLQDTPIAISAVSGQKLENIGATDLFTAAPYLPGVSINGTAGYGNFPVGIRGIASSTSLIGSDDPVAVYIDGVYVGKPSAVMASLLDIAEVEVVRGPQGTLYGRNASAGALLLTHKPPSSTPAFSANASYGSFGRWLVDARASGPLAEGLSGSLAVSHTDMSGWGENTYDDTRAVRREATAAASSLAMEAGALKATLRADYQDETVHDGLKKINAVPFNTANPITADYSLIGDADTYAFNYPTRYHRVGGGLSLNTEFALDGGAVLHTVSAYRYDQLDGVIDTDGTAANLNTNRTDEGLNQYSETVYLTGEEGWGSWVAGVDFYKGLTRTEQLVGIPVIASSLDIFATNDTTSGAVFAEMTRKFGAFSLTAGGRLTTESKRFEDRGVGTGLAPSTAEVTLTRNWTAFTPSVRLTYQPSDALLAYASVATGFKSGGFTALQATAFDPERVVTYEAGAKTTWLGGRLTLNGDVYYSDYKDLQVRVPVSVGVIQTLNAASATIKGAEIEGVWRVTDRLSFTGFANFTDARYDDYVGPGGIQNGGQYLSRAPRWQDGATARYEQPLQSGLISAEVTYSHRSQIFFSAPNLTGLSSPTYSQVDARLSYESAGGHWTAAVLGKNLTGDRHVQNVVVFGTNLIASFNEPTSYELKIGYKY